MSDGSEPEKFDNWTDAMKWIKSNKKGRDKLEKELGEVIEPTSNATNATNATTARVMLESKGLFGSKKKMIVRFFKAGHCVGMKKVKYGATEISFKKRMFTLNYDTMYFNQKGIPELNHDFDNSALSMQLNGYRDKYIAKADSQIVRDLYKRGTVKAIWGVDAIPFLLMVILAGALIVGLVFAFYMFGQYQAQTKQIEALKTENNQLKALQPIIPPVSYNYNG